MRKSTSWSFSVLLVAIAWVGAASAQTSDQKLIRWFDVQSKQTIRAYFDGVTNDNVRLKTKSGETVSISINRLSDTNQRYIRNVQKTADNQNPAKKVGFISNVDSTTKTKTENANADKADAHPDAIAKPKTKKKPAPGKVKNQKPSAPILAKSKPMYGVNWLPIDRVLTEQPIENKKPVFWFRVLGDLEGFM